MDREFILYTDFNCPFCYAFGERLLALQAADRVAWRGVQHAPQLPVPMASAGPHFRRELEREVHAVQRLAPEVPISLPSGKPNTRAAIEAVAHAMHVDVSKAHRLATAFYRAFWQQGMDISDPVIIQSLTREAGLQDPSDPTEAQSVSQSWHAEWIERGGSSVPELVRGDGEALVGLVDQEALHRFLASR